MSEIREAFAPLAEAYKKQFNVELQLVGIGMDADGNESEVQVGDDSNDGVRRVGSVKSNWLKRNAPKFGFVRQGEGIIFSWNGAAPALQVTGPVAAENAEIAAVATAVEAMDNKDEIEELTDVQLLGVSVDLDGDGNLEIPLSIGSDDPEEES